MLVSATAAGSLSAVGLLDAFAALVVAETMPNPPSITDGELVAVPPLSLIDAREGAFFVETAAAAMIEWRDESGFWRGINGNGFPARIG